MKECTSRRYAQNDNGSQHLTISGKLDKVKFLPLQKYFLLLAIFLPSWIDWSVVTLSFITRILLGIKYTRKNHACILF